MLHTTDVLLIVSVIVPTAIMLYIRYRTERSMNTNVTVRKEDDFVVYHTTKCNISDILDENEQLRKELAILRSENAKLKLGVRAALAKQGMI